VTLAEPFPRVLVVRRVTVPGARYFGPYTDVATLRQTLRIIRRLFTVRSCHYALPGDAPERPCLDYHIERCRAPGYQSREDYARMIETTRALGDTVDVRGRLRSARKRQAGSTSSARPLRDRPAVAGAGGRSPAVELVGWDVDAIGYARDGDDACGVTLRVGTAAWWRATSLRARSRPLMRPCSAFLVLLPPLEAQAERLLPLVPEDLACSRRWRPASLACRGRTAAKLVELADQNARHCSTAC
jgi:excinuclease UvrABC nuclease subunit